MTAIIGISYFALDAALAATLTRSRPRVHFVSLFFLVFGGGTVFLYGLVVCHTPLSLAFALLCGGKILFLAWRFKDLQAVLRTTDIRDVAGVIAFLFITTVLVARKGLIFWDDWGNWAFVAKMIWHFDGLPEARPGIYYDYMLLQSFYWSAFHWPGDAFQEKLGPAIAWLVYAIGMLRFAPNRGAYFVITLVLPFAFSVEVFGTAYADGITALAFALLSLELWEILEEDGSFLKAVGPLLLLLFAKPAGLYLALIALVALWLVLVISKSKIFPAFQSNGKLRRAGLSTLFFLGIILGKFLLVKLFLWQVGAEEAQALKRTPFEAYDQGFYHAYLRAVRQSIFTNERFIFILPAALVVNLALLPASLRLNRLLYFFLALAGNALFIIFASISFFSEQEIRRAASFARYLEHVYLFGIVLLIDSGGRMLAVLRERFQPRLGRTSRALLVLFVLTAMYFFGGFAYYHYKHPLLKKTIRTAKTCAKNEGRFILVAQNDSGLFFHAARLYVYPKPMSGIWQFCPGDRDAEGNACRPTPNRESLFEILRDYDYLILVKDDEYLKKTLWPESLPYPAALPACVDLRGLRKG